MIRDLYQKLYERQAAFYRKRPWARKTLFIANYVLTAAVFLAYAFLCLFELIIHNPVRADVVRILGVPLLCLFAVSLLRNLIDRQTPLRGGRNISRHSKEKTRPFVSQPPRRFGVCHRHGAVALLRMAGAAVLLAARCSGTCALPRGFITPPTCSRARFGHSVRADGVYLNISQTRRG